MAKKTEKQARSEGRQQRRIERQRRLITEAAARVFAAKGYASATTKEIAQEADIGESTLYNYFDSKRDILFAIVDETEPPMLSTLLELKKIGPGDREALTAVFEKLLLISKEKQPSTRALISEAWLNDDILEAFVVRSIKQSHQILEAYIAKQIAAGLCNPVDPTVSAWLMISMFGGLVLAAARGIGFLDSAEQRRAVAEAGIGLLSDGLRIRKD
jgi:AcrR family transcriptional regulator